MASERAEMTIDEVARAAGTTTRNVRAYQTRGLLPPPRLVGRVGVYGPEHLARLQLVARLQERGYSLAAIDDLVRAWEAEKSLGDLLGAERDIDPLAEDERSIELAEAELAQRFPMIVRDDGLVARAVALGIAEPLPGVPRRFRIPSPRLLDVGQALLQLGVPLSEVFDVLAELRRHADEVAAAMVEMFARHVIAPWVAAGQPLDELPDLLDRIRRTKPLPITAVNAVLVQALEREVGKVLAAMVPPRGKP